MSTIITILSKIPNIGKEIKKLSPHLFINDISLKSNRDHFSNSEIIIGDFDLLIQHLDYLKHFKWIQGTWAGVENFLPYMKDELASVIVTRFSGKHFGRLISEYVVANIVNYERNMYQVYENQKQKLWSQNGRIGNYRSLQDLTIGILGTGNIGNYRTLYSLGASVWGYGRNKNLKENTNFTNYERYCTKIQLPVLLESCNYIINCLPSTNETAGLLNNGILECCAQKQAVLINVGRGNIISKADLIEALQKQWLSAAILDVFEDEPLNAQNELWNMNQVFITPHVAGISRARDIAEQFLNNLKLYENKSTLPTQIFPGQQY